MKGGDSNVGGLVGQNDGTITNSYARGSVEGHKKVGGLVGYQQAGTISNAYATGGVNGSSNVVGGLVGDNRGVLNNVYATGSVDGKSYVGGLVGWNGKGGMIGSAYATGSVAASIRDSGGLVGLNDGKVLANTYWNTETTGQSDSAGGTGLTTAQMFEASRLAGFDFDWQLLDRLKLTQDLNALAETGGEATIILERANTSINLVTGLDFQVSDRLRSRLSYQVEYDSNPPPGKVSTDTHTRATLIYGF